jgi:hypothetical protein
VVKVFARQLPPVSSHPHAEGDPGQASTRAGPRAPASAGQETALTVTLLLSLGLLAFILGLPMGRSAHAGSDAAETERSLHRASYTASDDWAAQLVKQEPIEQKACNKSKGTLGDNEHCAVHQAIVVRLREMNWCGPRLFGQPYQQQWRKCSFTLAEQLFAMGDDCLHATEETSPNQAAKMCRRLSEQPKSMCLDHDAPGQVCQIVMDDLATRAATLEASMAHQ